MIEFYSVKKGFRARVNDFVRTLTASLILFFIITINFKAFSQAPTVTTPTVASVTTTGATLGGTVTGTLTHRGTRWSTVSPVFDANELEEASTTSGVFTQARTGLPSAAQIFFVAYARNGTDEGATLEASFFTKPLQLTGGQFSVAGSSTTSITLTFPAANSWKGAGATAGYVIYRKEGSAPAIGALADGAAPPVDGTGDKIATLTNEAATTFNNTGLNPEANYFYTIIPFVWDGSTNSTYNYNTTAPQTANAYTFSDEPTNQPGTFTATGISTTQVNLAFTDAATLGNAVGYIILRRQDGTNPTITGVTDGVAPGSLSLPAGTTLVTTIATGETTYNNTGLTAGIGYRYLILPFNYDGANNGTYNYKTDGTTLTATGSTFSLEPSGHTTLFEALATSATTISLNFNSITTSGITNGAGFIILRREDGTNPTGTGVVDGVAPGVLSLPAGTTFVTTINSTSTNTFNNTGLTTGTQYNYAIIPFNWDGSNGGTYNYYTAATIPTDFSTPAAGPTIVTLNPADGSSVGLTLTNAVITFNVNVAKINGGAANDTRTFRLYQVGNATPIATVDKDNATGYNTATITIPFNASLTVNTDYYIQAGSNILKIAPNSTAWGGIDDNTTWNFKAAAAVVQPATTLNLCYDGDYQTLSNIVIRESSVSDFAPGANQTYSIILPNGFVFNPAITTAPSLAGSNISAASALTYLSGNTVVRFSYTITGTSGTLDQITLSGLQVKYIGNTPASGNIVRIGGSAIQVGNSDSDGQNHGTLIADPAFGSTPDYTVQELPGDPPVTPTDIRFSATSKEIKLIGAPTGGDFSGNGATFTVANGWIFDIPSLGSGTYPITYSVRETSSQHCMTSFTKTLEIYSSVIQNLNLQYCSNGNASTGLTVSQTQINNLYSSNPPGTYVLKDFVYYNGSAWVNISNPNSTTFDPKVADYENAVSIYGGVYVYYRVTDAATQTQTIFADWQFVRFFKPPTVSYSIPKLDYCVDESPVSLIGSPPPQVPATDNFAGPGTSSPSTNNWIFTPSLVPNANTSTQVIQVTYAYRDPGTTCSNTFSRTITVSPRPTAVSVGNLNPGTAISVCQDGTPGSFNATPVDGTTYLWYSNNPPSALLAIGNSFSPGPFMSTSSPGTTDFSITRVISGCESPPLGLTVTVNATPSSPGSSFSREYCLNDNIPNSDFTVTGSNIKWVDAATGQTLNVANPNQPTIQELGITNNPANRYNYIVSQAVSGCESPPITVGAAVFDLPKIFIASNADLMKVCKTGGAISLNGSPGNGLWSGSASFALFNTNQAAGTTQLNPGSLNPDPGNYNLRYDFTDDNSCSNFETVNIQVLPTIDPSISIGTACDGLPVVFTNNSQVNPSSSPTTISVTSWNFGDGSGTPFGSGTIPASTNGGRTTGTYFSPNHSFPNVGTFQFNYSMITSDGCVVEVPLQPITINQIPNVNYSWINVCQGSATQFSASTNNTPPIPDNEMTYVWDFAKSGQLNFTTPILSGNGNSATVTYINVGRDTVFLTATSAANCTKTIQRPVFIVPSTAPIKEAYSYVQNFNSDTDGADGWLVGGSNASWEFGVPGGNVINRDSSATGLGKAWVTKLNGPYNPNEKSWVLSRCFDFSDAQKPVISFDIWADTPGGIDGAVLQYNESGNIENDGDWIVIGTVNAGINWYEQQGIASKPGNQSQFDYGWSGNADDGRYKGWKQAVFKLDNLIGKSNIVFRIAFSSNTATNREGFAFDNVFIGERTRNVLVESFTNTSTIANSKTHNDFYSLFEASSPEVVKIQYHTGFPGTDPIHELNKSMNDARAGFYGLTASPVLRIDGKFKTGIPSTWATNLYDNEILQPSPVKIIIQNPVKTDGVVKINVSLTNITTSPVSLQGKNAFIVILEKEIDQQPWLGNNGDTKFHYVARTVLPTAAGINLNNTTLAANETIHLEEVIWKDNVLIKQGTNNVAIAAFIQALTAGGQEVMQASLLSTPIPEPNLITGLEDPHFADKIQVYPNPANEEVHVELPAPVTNATPIRLMDAQGRLVFEGSFGSGEYRKTIDTSSFAGGMYILQIQTNETKVWRKVLIAHQGN